MIPKWHDHNAKDNAPFLDALAKARDIAVKEGYCYHHVQAIIVSIDQYAEAVTATGSISRTRRTPLAAQEKLAKWGVKPTLARHARLQELVPLGPIPPEQKEKAAGHYAVGLFFATAGPGRPVLPHCWAIVRLHD